MLQLVDAIMLEFARKGTYFPKDKRKPFKIRVTETSSYTIEVIADCLDSAKDIAQNIFNVNRNMFEKECTVKVTDCNSKKSTGRIRQSFSRFSP